MKKQNLFLLGILAASIISYNFSTEKTRVAAESISLQEAENGALVKTKIVSKGKYTGDCMNLSVTNLQKIAQKISIPAGTVFIADEGSEQNILVTQDIICNLKPGESKTLDISGYCCEHDDSAPDEGSSFKTSIHKDAKVQKLVTFLNNKQYEDHTIQDAVWCVANGSSISNIYCEDQAKQKELVQFVSDLTGQKETWYTNKQDHSVDENRRIISAPVEINGMLTCTIESPVNVSNYVYDSENNLIHTMGPMRFPMKGKYDYEFKLTVEGWEKGKYYILVKADQKQLLRQDFEI